MSAYEHLHPLIQRWIHRKGWPRLRDIQEQAIPVVLAAERDLLIMAPTAGGKTEAAFLPILSRLVGEAHGSVRALAISPLKALINDQFERLEGMTVDLDVPVHRWHGDVSSSAKRRVREQPSGVLIITPESLEALFIRRGTQVGPMFRSLEHLVVDELHAFIGTERGRQLQSLLHRMETAVGRRVPRIALSATLGDLPMACEFLRPGHGEEVVQLRGAGGEHRLQLQVRGYKRTTPRVAPPTGREPTGDIEEDRPAGQHGSDLGDDPEETPGDGSDHRISEHLFRTLRGGHHLVFANSRNGVELFADLLSRQCQRQNLPEEFWPHHGNLSRTLREHAEERLKDRTRPATLIATTTLELGIDVGAIESVAQVGVPPSVASLRQRLGRSGRTDGTSVLRVYIQEPEITERTPPADTLRTHLVHVTAAIELMGTGWIEPPEPAALHLSTLVHQVLSSVAQHGGRTAQRAYHELCRTGPFSGVTPELFVELLRNLGEADLLTQTHDGELVLGLDGERLVDHYEFYAAFQTPDEYRLVFGAKTLGKLPMAQPLYPGANLIFGGRRWKVLSVDEDRKVIELQPAAGGVLPLFSSGRWAPVHDEIRRAMGALYRSDRVPPFLDPPARDLLDEGRENFRRLGLQRGAFVADGGDTLWFPWRGDKILSTLELAVRAREVDTMAYGPVLQFSERTPDQVRQLLRDLLDAPPPTALELADRVENKAPEKYHPYLSDGLLTADYASSSLDVEAAWKALDEARAAGEL